MAELDEAATRRKSGGNGAERFTTAISHTGLVQQPVQIVASHNLTLLVRRHSSSWLALAEAHRTWEVNL